MKYYSLILALVAVSAAILLGVILLLDQKRFFKYETSATLSYAPVAFSDKSFSPSFFEVLQIVQADLVKKEAFDLSAIAKAQPKEKYLKKALGISSDPSSNSSNLMQVSVKWDDIDEARQLTENYIKAAINSYFRSRNKYLQEIRQRLLKTRMQAEARKADIEKQLSHLSQSAQDENLKSELETLKLRRNKQEDELSSLTKQHAMAQVQYEGMKAITPNKDKEQKIKNALQHAFVLELVKKKNDTLEDFEVQKATGKENDLQFKQSQIRYAYTDDCLKRALDELNLTEQDILEFDSASLKRMEEMESSEASMIVLQKHINSVREALDKTQKQISDVRKLLPQEESLNEEHGRTIRQINEIDQEFKNIDNHILMTVLELQSLGFINIHHVSVFTSKNYILAILIGTIVTTSLFSLLLLIMEIGRHHSKTSVQQ